MGSSTEEQEQKKSEPTRLKPSIVAIPAGVTVDPITPNPGEQVKHANFFKCYPYEQFKQVFSDFHIHGSMCNGYVLILRRQSNAYPLNTYWLAVGMGMGGGKPFGVYFYGKFMGQGSEEGSVEFQSPFSLLSEHSVMLQRMFDEEYRKYELTEEDIETLLTRTRMVVMNNYSNYKLYKNLDIHVSDSGDIRWTHTDDGSDVNVHFMSPFDIQ